MTKLEVEVLYRQNKNTGKIHRVFKAPNGQLMTGEQCNLDQAHNTLDEEELRESDSSHHCLHCFGNA